MKRFATLLVACFLLSLIALSSASAQLGTRDSAYESIRLYGYSFTEIFTRLPSSGTIADVRSLYENQSQPPVHACWGGDSGGQIEDSTGTYPVYTRVRHPGGTLTVDLAGSNYDTVLSIFAQPSEDVFGSAVACNDDFNNSVVSSRIQQVLPAGVYIIMVSRYNLSFPAPSALSLTMNLSYSLDGVIPANDSFYEATPLSLGVALTQTDIHYTNMNSEDYQTNATCDMGNALWYEFAPPVEGSYTFNTYGSQLMTYPTQMDNTTVIGVYTYSNAGGNFYLLGCYSGRPAVTAPIQANETYYVRVGTTYANVLPGSRYRIKAVATTVNLTTNSGLYDNLAGWKSTKFTADDVIVGSSVVINAGATKKTFSQTKTTFPKYVKWTKGGTITLNARYKTSGVPLGKFTAIVTYSDGKPKTVLNIPFSATPLDSLIDVALPLTLTSSKVKSVKVIATVNPGSGTSMTLEEFYLMYSRDTGTTRSATLLTLPPAQ